MSNSRQSTTPIELAKVAGGPAHANYAAKLVALLDEHDVTSRSKLVETSAGRAFVLETGAGGQPVVFLHGTPATSAVWVPLLADLHGVHAYAVDRPSSGLSGDFEYGQLSPTETRTHAVAFIDSLLDALGLESAAFVGSSYGGLWALWFALARPERVRRIVLAGAPPGLLGPRLPAIFGILSVPVLAATLQRVDPPSFGATKRFFRMMGDPPSGLSDRFVAAFTASQRLPGTGSLLRGIQQVVRFPGRLDRALWLDADSLRQIRVPTRFVWGPADFLGGPELGRRAVQVMPNADLQVIGTGHLPWLQDPSGVASAIEDFAD